MNVAIIPARGGSKRIPRKNIREFCGKPMIVWSIEAALHSGVFDRVIVSTDDEETAQIAMKHGADVPFRRPHELANDHAGTLPVIRHAVEWMVDRGCAFDHACCIYATAPLLDLKYLREAFDLLKSTPQTDFVFAATRFEFPIFRALKLGSGNQASLFWPEYETARSQDLPAAYHDAGQFYWGTKNAWLEKERILSSTTRAVILPNSLVQDIDTPEDWEHAELKFKLCQAGLKYV
jgi:N-acylneuraminate cytidylyltransferase